MKNGGVSVGPIRNYIQEVLDTLPPFRLLRVKPMGRGKKAKECAQIAQAILDTTPMVFYIVELDEIFVGTVDEAFMDHLKNDVFWNYQREFTYELLGEL